MSGFDRAVAFVLEHETRDDTGWTQPDPNDRGGRTRFGISSRAHPDVDLAALTRDGAVELYRARYWLPLRGDELPQALAFALFDHSVPSGVSRAVCALQRALVPRYTSRIDGAMGPMTLRAVRDWDPAELLQRVLHERVRDLVAAGANQKQRIYLAGWLGRVVDVALAMPAL